MSETKTRRPRVKRPPVYSDMVVKKDKNNSHLVHILKGAVSLCSASVAETKVEPGGYSLCAKCNRIYIYEGVE